MAAVRSSSSSIAVRRSIPSLGATSGCNWPPATRRSPRSTRHARSDSPKRRPADGSGTRSRHQGLPALGAQPQRPDRVTGLSLPGERDQRPVPPLSRRAGDESRLSRRAMARASWAAPPTTLTSARAIAAALRCRGAAELHPYLASASAAVWCASAACACARAARSSASAALVCASHAAAVALAARSIASVNGSLAMTLAKREQRRLGLSGEVVANMVESRC